MLRNGLPLVNVHPLVHIQAEGSIACKCKLYHGENHTIILVSKLSEKLNSFCPVCGPPG